ncbi:MAG: DUF2970 domain-containing protein [Pseudomonadota bacterium]
MLDSGKVATRLVDEDSVMSGNPQAQIQADERQQETPAESANNSRGNSKGLNPVQVISSVLAAALGVQSSKNRERDFKQGRAGVFIISGIVFTALFIGAVFTVVSFVLSTR